jgi:hypothetical protein
MAVTIEHVVTVTEAMAIAMTEVTEAQSSAMAKIGVTAVMTAAVADSQVGVSAMTHSEVTGTVMTSTVNHIDLLCCT